MIRIDVLTTTRAEYGLMRPLIRRMIADPDIQMNLLVTGTHLSEKHGNTYKEIERDGFPITAKIPILGESSGAVGVSQTMANAIVEFTKFFIANRPDFVLVDGDRYETLGICIAAVNANVPIIHCSGGATTEGAADECYRHSMTKMAYLHFPTTEIYRNRIIQMGESPDRVFTVGSMGLENILQIDYLSKEELSEQIGWSLIKPFSVVTFHPVTLENNTCKQQLNELLRACETRQDMQFIFTKANADNGGDEINQILDEYTASSTNAICVTSLGAVRYLSALKYAEFVMGNSSSGIIEAPSMKIPTINIGDRQRGRLQAQSIINCAPKTADILNAINKALSPEFKDVCKHVVNPNGDGKTSERIVSHIKEYCSTHQVDIMKKFYDLPK
mgnify:CR=1 FL=1